MASSTTAEKPRPPKPSSGQWVGYDEFIERQIRKTRAQVKGVEIATALMILAAGSLAFFLVAAVLDHWILPHGLGFWGRLIGLALFLGGACYFSIQRLLPWLFYRINPIYAAQAIEKSRPTLKNTLINFLFLRGESARMPTAVYQAVEEQAAKGLSRVQVESAVDRTRLIHIGYALLAIVVLFAGYFLLSPKNPWDTVGRVMLPWADIQPPTRVEILDVQPGSRTVFRGQLVEVSAEIHGLKQDEPVQVVYSTADHESVDQPVTMYCPPDRFRYSAKIPLEAAAPGGGQPEAGVQQDIDYRLEAGDAISPTYHLHAVTAPTIALESVEYQYPEYTGRAPLVLKSIGDIQSLEGTQITIHGRANQPIKSADVELDGNGGRVKRPMQIGSDGRTVTGTFTLALDEQDHTSPQFSHYRLRPEGRAEPEPVQYRIDVIADQPPEVKFIFPEKDDVMLPVNRRLNLRLRALDPDFALSELNLSAEANRNPILHQQLLNEIRRKPMQVDYTIDPAKLNLKAGDVVEYWAEARDNRQPQANTTETSKRRIRIVAADARQNEQSQGDGSSESGQSDRSNNANPPDKQNGQKPQGDGTKHDSSRSEKKPGDNGQQNNPAQRQSDNPANPADQQDQQPNQPQNPQQKNPRGQQDQSRSGQDKQSADNPQKQNQPQQPQNGQGGGGNAKQQPQQDNSQRGQNSQPNQNDQNSENNKRSNPKGGGLNKDLQNSKSTGNESGGNNSQSNNNSSSNTSNGPKSGSENAGSQPPNNGAQPNGDRNPDGKSQGNAKPQSQPQDQPAADGSDDAQAMKDVADYLKRNNKNGSHQSQPKDAAQQKPNGDQSKPADQSGSQSDKKNGQGNQGHSEGQKQPGEKSSAEKPASDNPNGQHPENGQPGQSEKHNSANADGSKPNGNQPSTQEGNARSNADEQSSPKTSANEKNPSDSNGANSTKENANSSSESRNSKSGDNANQLDKNRTANNRQSAEGQNKSGTGNQDQQGKGERTKDGSPTSSDKPDTHQSKEQSQMTGGDPNANKGKAGAGTDTAKNDKPTPPSPADANKPNEHKDQKPDGEGKKEIQPKDSGTASTVSPKESNSKSDPQPDGTFSGGGGKNGGQQAKQSGTGGAGSHSGAEQGNGISAGKGQGDTSDKAGSDKIADHRTGRSSGNEKGPGTESHAGRSNEKSTTAQQSKPSADGDKQRGDSQRGAPAKNSENPGNRGGAPIPQVGGGGAYDSNGPPPTAPRNTGDPANAAFAKKQFDMALNSLKKGNPELLKELNWTPEQAQQLADRLERMRQNANLPGAKGEIARQQLDDIMQSLGDRSGRYDRASGGNATDDQRGLHESHDAGPPPAYSEQVEAFKQGILQSGK